MKKQILVLFVLVFSVTNLILAQNSKRPNLDAYSHLAFKIKIVGDAVLGENTTKKDFNIRMILDELRNSESPTQYPVSIQLINTGATTSYDLVSNGVPENICQDANAPDKIHTAFISSTYGDTAFTSRRTKYYYSTNRGISWSFISDVPNGIRSGFASITIFSDGTEMLSCALPSGVPPSVRITWFKDAFPGLGSFIRIDHTYPGTGIGFNWPRIATSYSISLPNKFITLASRGDSLFYTICQNQNNTFTPWVGLGESGGEKYSVAKSNDGRFGIVYIKSAIENPNEYGSVYFLESTNSGSNFSTPVKIFQPNFNTDSLAAFCGISMVYLNNVPCVTFETVKQTTYGSFFPGAPANIRFWSSTLPGIDPNRSIILADTHNVGWHPYISKGQLNDPFASLCRPTIGYSGNFLYTAFMVPSGLVGGTPDTTSFMDIWLCGSTNNGQNWGGYTKINPTTPRNDWTFPCMSPNNDYNATTGARYANLSMLCDSIPGTYINHPSNGQSIAKYYFGRISLINLSPPPILSTPVNGATNVFLNPNLSWSGGWNTYNLNISTNPQFQNIIFQTTCSITNFTIPLGILSPCTTYYWRVRGSDDFSTSDWSSTFNFTTGPNGIRNINSEIPKENKLYVNYPNPFNQSSIINFQCSMTGKVQLKVYDILGKEVAILVNEKLQPGTYEIVFNEESFSTGVYFYRITMNGFTDTKKMLMIK